MAHLHTLPFSISSSGSCSTNKIPQIISSSSSSYTTLSPNLSTLSLSPRKPTSLSLHTKFHHTIRCSSPGSVLTLETQQLDDENEVSTTRLLAQNVPWSSTADDIRALFQQFGTVVEVELSMHNKTRNRGLAFVEMSSAEEAAEAFAKLEAFEYEGRNLKMTYAKPKKKKLAPPVQSKPPVVYNLFVANLPFEARAKDLKAFFQAGGSDPISAEVIFYDHPRKSAGYGFVSFQTKREADEVLLGFEGKELLGRPIRVARSKRFVKLESEMNSRPEEEEELLTDSSQGSGQPAASDIWIRD